MSVEVFIEGSHAIAKAEFRDEDDALQDPSGGATITVTDADSTVQVDAQAMTKSETGKYYYNIDTDGFAVGWCSALVVATDGSPALISKEITGFQVR